MSWLCLMPPCRPTSSASPQPCRQVSRWKSTRRTPAACAVLATTPTSRWLTSWATSSSGPNPTVPAPAGISHSGGTMYRVYLRTFDQRVLPESKTNTTNPAAAREAFAELVERTELDGQKLAAVLSYDNRQLAFHRFDREPGRADYWRDRLDEIEWPGIGRPVTLTGGRRVQVYLDAPSLEAAERLGCGNGSGGVIIGLGV